MSVARERFVFGGTRGPRAPRTRSAAGAFAAGALVALAAPVIGCAQGPADGLDEEEVSSAALPSRFNCASAFGLIGAAVYMTGDIVVPSGDTVSVATTPAGSPTLDCTSGGTVVINWQPIQVRVPVSGGMSSKILLKDFTVFGTPGAQTPGDCVAPTPCYPGTINPQCADDTELLWFDTQVCTLAAFSAGLCQLSSAQAQVCGTL